MLKNEPSPGADCSERPLFARQPLLGLALAASGGLVFAILALNVRRRGRLVRWDEAASRALHRRAVRLSPPILAFMRFCATLGREWALVVALMLGGYWLIRRRWRPLAMLLVGVIGGNTWFVVLSRFFHRRRPTFVNPFHTVDGPGFPSGHSLTSVTLYGLAFYLWLPRLRSWRWHFLGGAPVSLIIVLIGLSRLYLGDHYPMDVVGGYGFGLFWGALSYTVIDVVLTWWTGS